MFAIRCGSKKNVLFRSLCWLMALVTPLSPSASLLAQTSENAGVVEQAKFVLPYAAAMASARPRQLLTCQAAEMMPVEVVQAACLKELGIDPLVVKQVVFSMIPPLAGPPSYAVLVELTERIDLSKVSTKLTAHTAPGERDGQTYLQSQNPQLPSLYWVGETTLLIAPEATLNQLLSNQADEPGDFAIQLASIAQDDLALIVNTAVLRPFIQMGLNQTAGEIPAEFQEYLEIPSLLKQARLRVNLSGNGPLELSCAADDAAAADRVEELLEQLTAVYRKQANQQAAELLASEDPVEQAMGRYMMRVTPAWSEQVVPEREGERFTIFETEAGDNVFAGPTGIATIGVLVALLLPAVQAAREAARRNSSMNNLKQIMLAMHIYADRNKSFPAHANYDDNGKPLLSWRVHILPYIDAQHLYEQFHLDEPWDSEHNKQLIPLMPEIYIDPSSKLSTTDGRTHYLGVQGEGFAFDGSEKGTGFARYRDGTSNSIVVVQSNDEAAVFWTRPEDWEPSKQVPLAGLANGPHPLSFLAGFADGHVSFIRSDVDTTVFGNLLTIAGGESIDPNTY